MVLVIICTISVSRQCILGEGKLVVVLVQLTLCNSCIYNAKIITILTFILDNQLESAETTKSILPNFT